jgi:acetyl esterase/lipase
MTDRKDPVLSQVQRLGLRRNTDSSLAGLFELDPRDTGSSKRTVHFGAQMTRPSRRSLTSALVSHSSHRLSHADCTSEILIDVYVPVRDSSPRPCIFKIHFDQVSIGSVASTDAYHRALTEELGCVLISLNGAQQPGLSFATSTEGCYETLAWAIKNSQTLGIDASRIGVTGEAAGSNLAAAVAVMTSERLDFSISFLHLSRPYAGEFLWMPRPEDLKWSSFLAQSSKTDALTRNGLTATDDYLCFPSTFISTGALVPFVEEAWNLVAE